VAAESFHDEFGSAAQKAEAPMMGASQAKSKIFLIDVQT
jgi:hypothetical protein